MQIRSHCIFLNKVIISHLGIYMQQLTVKIDFLNSLNLRLKHAARLPFTNRNERVSSNLSQCLSNEISP